MLEVELKFRAGDEAVLREQLASLGAVARDSVEQVDLYFNHPARDFAVTDEALRVRTVGDTSSITYKGPKQGAAAKTRFELDLPLGSLSEGSTTEAWAELLTRLGFREVTTVTKRRTAYELERTGRRFEVSLDAVEGLGAFVEVETLAEEDDREAAEQAVHALAAELGLAQPEPRSYLEMLLGFTEPRGS